MKEQVTIIKGPIPPLSGSFLRWQSLFHIVYSVSLDNGLIVTNPDQFPEESLGITELPSPPPPPISSATPSPAVSGSGLSGWCPS